MIKHNIKKAIQMICLVVFLMICGFYIDWYYLKYSKVKEVKYKKMDNDYIVSQKYLSKEIEKLEDKIETIERETESKLKVIPGDISEYNTKKEKGYFTIIYHSNISLRQIDNLKNKIKLLHDIEYPNWQRPTIEWHDELISIK